MEPISEQFAWKVGIQSPQASENDVWLFDIYNLVICYIAMERSTHFQ